MDNLYCTDHLNNKLLQKLQEGGTTLLIEYLNTVQAKITQYLAKLSDPVSFLYCVSRTTTRIFLDNFKLRKYLQQDDIRDLR